MGKPGKWLKHFLIGKKDKDSKDKSKQPIPFPPKTPREKRRWSFRRSSATHKDGTSTPEPPPGSSSAFTLSGASEAKSNQKRQALAVAAATAAAADAAVAAAQAAAAVIQLTGGAGGHTPRTNPIREAAAIRIQSFYRSYLARKALRALRGLVKLQALARGHLVRRQAAATLRCMQAMVTVQARARIQRLQVSEDSRSTNPRPSTHRRSTREDHRFRNINQEFEKVAEEENVKIVEMDMGEMRTPPTKSRTSYSNQEANNQISPAPSALTEMSPRTCSGHFEDYAPLWTAQSSPQCYSAMAKIDTSRVPFSDDYCPNYMANTESSRAKACRSQSAPKQRLPEYYFERQPGMGRRVSMDGGRNGVPRTVRIQRSSSHLGSAAAAAAQKYHYPPWSSSSVKLDRSTMSLRDSECGSTSTVLTSTNYCRSHDTRRSRCQKGRPPPHHRHRAV
ncbi:hypothetical protein SAY86_017975 [Trapa natans]|uniref:DUF4005 domain-containing protein n=1 Tax=Trapa natans TaxID=22666 RepID=A0AAN7M624_TRANT|nr:hypothetical protein SAY86_017975 [Trapa natans]